MYLKPQSFSGKQDLCNSSMKPFLQFVYILMKNEVFWFFLKLLP